MDIEKVKHLYLKTFLITLAAAALIFLPAMIYDNGYFLFVGDFNSQQIPFYMNVHDSIRRTAADAENGLRSLICVRLSETIRQT